MVSREVQNKIDVIYHTYTNWEFYSAVKLINEIEESHDYTFIPLHTKIFLKRIKIHCLGSLNRYEDQHNALTELNLVTTINENFDIVTQFYIIDSKVNEIYFNSIILLESNFNSLLNEGLKLINLIVSNQESDIIEVTYMLFFFYTTVAYLFLGENNKENSLEYFTKAMESARINENLFLMWAGYFNLRYYYLSFFDYKSAKKITEEELNYFKSINNEFYISKALSEYTTFLTNRGKLKDALIYNKESLKIINAEKKDLLIEIHDLVIKNQCYASRAILLAYMGKYKESIEWSLKSLEIADIYQRKYGYKGMLSNLLGNLGEMYEDSGNFKTALQYQEKAFEIRKKQRILPWTARSLCESYYQLIKITIELQKIEEANNYLNEFSNFFKGIRSEVLTKENFAKLDIAKALILLTRKSMDTNVQAQQILRKVVTESKVKLELQIDALLPLIDLSLQEFKFFQTDEKLITIKELVERLRIIAEQSIAIPLKIQAHLLQGRLDLILNNFDDFEQNFKYASDLAKEYDLEFLVSHINQELSELSSEFEKLQIIMSNSSIASRIEKSNIKSYVDFVKKYIEV